MHPDLLIPNRAHLSSIRIVHLHSQAPACLNLNEMSSLDYCLAQHFMR